MKRRHGKQYYIEIIMLCIMIFGLVGCGSKKKSEVNATIKLAIYPLTAPYFEYAMEELELFEKNGVNVELVYFAQYSDVIQALNAGNVDGSIMGITEAVSPIINDLDLQIICMTDYSYGMDGLVVKSDVNSVADLKGKTIATNVGTMNHMLLLNALEEAGLSESDLNIINMNEGDATAAFIGGSIDAASIFDPQMQAAATEGNGKIIYSSKDMKGELADVLLIKKSVIDSNRDQVMGLIKAWYDVIDEFNTNQEKVVDIISKNADLSNEEFLELVAGIEIATKDYNQEVFANSGEKMVALIEKVSKFLMDTGYISEIPAKEKIEKAVDVSFIEELVENK